MTEAIMPPRETNAGANESSALFVQALRGDSDAATRLYNTCVPRLRCWLERRVPAAQAAELAHDTMVRAFRHGHRFDVNASFMAWVCTIARRMVMTHQRDEARRRTRESAWFEHERVQAGSHAVAEDDRIVVMRRCVHALPQDQQQLVRQRFGQDQSAAEIAAFTGRKREAVAVSLHRICKRLRTSMEQRLGDRPSIQNRRAA